MAERAFTVLIRGDDERWRVFSYAPTPELAEVEAGRMGVGLAGPRPYKVVPGHLPFSHEGIPDREVHDG